MGSYACLFHVVQRLQIQVMFAKQVLLPTELSPQCPHSLSPSVSFFIFVLYKLYAQAYNQLYLLHKDKTKTGSQIWRRYKYK